MPVLLNPSRFGSAAADFASVMGASSPLWWPRLGEAAPSTTMTDNSGNGHDGTYTDDDILGATGLIAGDSDTGINPQGVTGALNNGNGAVVDGAWMNVTAITLGVWVNLAGAQSNRGILTRFGSGGAGSGQDWLLWMDASGKLAVRFYNTSGSQVDLAWATTPTVGTTYFVVPTYQSGQARLYINATEVASSTALTGNLRAAACPINVGTYQGSNSFRFNGTIDEPAMWDGELTSGQIGDIYAAGT